MLAVRLGLVLNSIDGVSVFLPRLRQVLAILEASMGGELLLTFAYWLPRKPWVGDNGILELYFRYRAGGNASASRVHIGLADC